MIAVVGATGMVGSDVESRLRAGGYEVVATSRRPSDGDCLRLELSDPVTWNVLPSDTTAVLVCGGISDVRECREHPETTRAVNVSAASEFAQFMAKRGAMPVMLSTSYVFDGSRPDFCPDDEVCPMSEYGRQKAAMERAVMSTIPESCIVRLTKVFGGTNRLLSNWRSAFLKGGSISAASDARVSPLTAEFVAEALAGMLVDPKAGLWQLSAADDVSWFEIAERLAARCGSGRAAVRAATLAELDPDIEFVPRFGSLKTVWPGKLPVQRSVLAVDRELENICASS
jgi:dTDP-4-dehydrorhamnose reductase